MLLQDNLQGIQHIAIFVTDINRSRSFYEQFGFKEKLSNEIPMDPEPVKLLFLELNGLTMQYPRLRASILAGVLVLAALAWISASSAVTLTQKLIQS